MRRIALTAALTLAVSACGLATSSGEVEGAWELASGTYDGSSIPVLQSHPITMTFDGDVVGGTAACNSYGGSFTLAPTGSLSVGDVSITEMACMPTEAMVAEQLFVSALLDVNGVVRANDVLTVTGPRTEMTFTLLPPVPTADLVGTVWVLDGLIMIDAVTSITGERATLELSAAGTFTGGTGCRELSGTYVVTGAEIQFTSFGAEGDCPPELQKQDSRVISALEGGFRVEIEGHRLTTRAAGNEGLSYRAEP